MKFFRRRLLALSAPLMFTACATMGPPQPPSLELPKAPLDLRAVRKGNHVTLSWTIPTVTTDRQAVRSVGPTRICRGLTAVLTECGTPVGEAAPAAIHATASSKRPKQNASYIDTIPADAGDANPGGQFTYAIEVLNAGGRGAGVSNSVHVPAVPTPPPPKLAARVTGAGIVLTSDDLPHDAADAQVKHLYRVYRRQEGDTHSVLVEEDKTDQSEIVDRSFEWEKTYVYRATMVSVLGSETQGCTPTAASTRAPGNLQAHASADCAVVKVEGDDSPEIKIFADDIFPPAVPTGLQAVFSGPGQQAFIDLIWAPVTDVDLDGYNIYRHEEGAAAVKVNASLVKSPAYRDAAVATGKNYFYSVSAVDVRGNESARSEEAGEAVP